MPLVFHWAKAPQSCDQSTLRPTVIDRDVLALEIAGISQTLPEPGHKVCRGAGRPSRPLQPIRKDLVIRFRRQRLAKEVIMAAKEISVKKYVVRLSGEERERLETLLRKGKSPARRVLKARILLKADVSEAGKGWSDNRIIEALETSPSM